MHFQKVLCYETIQASQWSYYHLTGCLVHTQCPHGKRPSCFLDLLEYPHDSNLTLNILLWTLETCSPLPPTIHLQFDNCFRENKNRYIFGVCALLVELKVVKKVRRPIKWIIEYPEWCDCTPYNTGHGEFPTSGPHPRRCRSDVLPDIGASQASRSQHGWGWVKRKITKRCRGRCRYSEIVSNFVS